MIRAKSLMIMLSTAASLGLAQQGFAEDAPAAPAAEAAPAAQAPAAEGAEAKADNVTAAYETDGKWFTAEDIPTFKIQEDGTVDWYTFSGFRRYNSECFVCHGPDGQGSSYAPALAKSVLRLDYYDVLAIVAGGKKEGNLVMPSFGDNKNVMCYLDDIYVYLKAMGTDSIPRGRPAKRADKPDGYKEQEDACMG